MLATFLAYEEVMDKITYSCESKLAFCIINSDRKRMKQYPKTTATK